jgi:putative membrane protein
MMMGNGGFDMGGGWIFGWIIMIVVLALIVVGVIFLVRGLSGRNDHSQVGQPQGPPPPAGPALKSALQVLEERYARGEIDREEFVQRKQDLLGS